MFENPYLAITKTAGAVSALFFAHLFGGADGLLYTLLTLTVVDYATGLLKGILSHRLSSSVMWKGGIKKIFIYVVVAVAVQVDAMIAVDHPILRSLVIGYYIATEGLSILENAAECGVPFPQKLKSVLEQIKHHHDKEDAGS